MTTKDRDTDGESLSEDEIRQIAQEETSVKSADGKTVRLADLVELGLDKQQAIGALGLVALGSGLGAAVATASSTSVSAQSASGSGTIEIGELIANHIETTEVSATELTGDVVGRATSITHLAGNIYVQEDEPASPDTDDVLFKLGGSS